MWKLYAIARMGSVLSQAGIALIAVIVAAIIGVWQLSGQKTPSDIFGTISIATLAGIALLFVLFICRLFIDGREEYERERNRKVVKEIGDFIGEGIGFTKCLEKMSVYDAAYATQRTEIIEKIANWEERMDTAIRKYDEKLVPILSDQSAAIVQSHTGQGGFEIHQRVDVRLQNLRQLLSIVAVR